MYESEDPLGNHGVRLSKEIVKVAGRAMEKNFTSLGPFVLPISEQYKVVKALALRKVRVFPCLVGVCFLVLVNCLSGVRPDHGLLSFLPTACLFSVRKNICFRLLFFFLVF